MIFHVDEGGRWFALDMVVVMIVVLDSIDGGDASYFISTRRLVVVRPRMFLP